MSNTLAIATVTATVQQLLQTAISSEFPGGIVKIGLPTKTTTPPTGPEVLVSLCQVIPNVAYRNADIPGRDPSGRLFAQPRIGIDLHYMFSFYGDESILEPQRLLGRVIQALHVQPVLTADMITQTIESPTYAVLANSNLAAEPIEQVKFVAKMTTDETPKIWNAFFHTVPYALSIAYLASVVIIEGAETLRVIPPVQQRSIRTYAVDDAAKAVLDRIGLPPLNKAEDISLSNYNVNAGIVTGDIVITRAIDEDDITHYVLYWGDNNGKLSTQPLITYLPKTSSDINFSFPANTTLPAGADRIFVLTMNSQAEMSVGLFVLLP